MSTNVAKIILASGLMMSALTLNASSVSALPALNGGATNISVVASSVEQVRWVCGPYRCWWRPNYYRPYGVYRPYGYYRPYGWRRPYGYGWRGGWGPRW